MKVNWKLDFKLKKRHIVFLLFSLGCFGLLFFYEYYLSNTILYNAISYTIPVVLLFNVVLLFVAILWRHQWLWLMPILFFIVNHDCTKSFFAHSFFVEKKEVADLVVLSYNVGTFNLDRFHQTDSVRIIDSLIMDRQKKFLLNCKADVVCLQEFYNNDALGFSTILDEMADIGYKYFYTNPVRIDGYEGFFGVITFSKFPIIDRGKIAFDYRENNRALNTAIYTDIVVGLDTVRIFNLHLHSMDLRVHQALSTLASDTGAVNWQLMKAKLEYGFMKRGKQIKKIEEKIFETKYRKILVGDLNDLPFSYTYQTLNRYLYNSFEEAGFGFGFTYNRFPWFIRIDNQFYSNGMTVAYFELKKDNAFSDHYPIIAGYSFE